jgi:hypothetical protein
MCTTHTETDIVIHVLPAPDGRWRVVIDGAVPLSVHGSADAAERAAHREAQRRGDAEVLVHDLYLRTHRSAD